MSRATVNFAHSRLAAAGGIAILLLVLASLFAPLLTPHDPDRQHLDGGIYLPPSVDHPLGTDKFGRDIFSRILYGGRVSLAIGFFAAAMSVTLGTLAGATAGYFRGVGEGVIMRVVDVLLAFPRLILLLALVALFHPSLVLLVVVLGLTGWMGTARIVRGEVLSLREREFILAGRALGFRAPRILFRHILPNVLGPVIVAATLSIGNTILIEASLSFLGLGVQPPMASWGSMINDGKEALTHAWWIATFPGLAVLVTVSCFNLVGDGMRDAFDPRFEP